jgi:hypothetical protein
MGQYRRQRLRESRLDRRSDPVVSYDLHCLLLNLGNMDVLPELTGAEWAAWLQAIGSIIAIGGSMWAVRYQARKQHKDALLRADIQRHAGKLDTARTIAELAKRSSNAAAAFREKFKDVNALRKYLGHDEPEYFDAGLFKYLDHIWTSIPLHTLPYEFVILVLYAANPVREIRQKFDTVLIADGANRLTDKLRSDFIESLANLAQLSERAALDAAKKLQELEGDYPRRIE